jgi:hypothetical protein
MYVVMHQAPSGAQTAIFRCQTEADCMKHAQKLALRLERGARLLVVRTAKGTDLTLLKVYEAAGQPDAG